MQFLFSFKETPTDFFIFAKLSFFLFFGGGRPEWPMRVVFLWVSSWSVETPARCIRGKRQHTQLITWQRMKQVDGNVGSKLESDAGEKKKDKIMADGPRAIDFVENRGSKKSRLAESNPHPSIHLLLLLLPGNIGKY
jgi:hypothetical protein